MANRCFSDTNRAITSSSDLTGVRKARTIYKSIESNYVGGLGPNPLKSNGARYQQNFYFSNCTTDATAGVMLAAHSYELMLALSKGSYYVNPTLQSAASGKYSMWGGNCTEVNYTKGGKYKYPNTYFAFDTIGDATKLYVLGDHIRYPYGCVTDCSYSGQYPGYIVDASTTIFYESCFGRDGADKAAPWIANVADVSFRWTNYYWQGANAQPLQGFAFPKKVNIGVNLDTPISRFTPLPPPDPSVCALGDCSLNALWCNGNYAIN